jgi:hypothetical protein
MDIRVYFGNEINPRSYLLITETFNRSRSFFYFFFIIPPLCFISFTKEY